MSKPRLLILKTGSALPEALALFGDFDAWFKNALGPSRFDYQVIAVDEGEFLPAPEASFAGVIITGSPAMVSHRLDWAEATLPWLRAVHALAKPMLGVCFGHQLLAHALGGEVGPNPCGRGIGAVWVDLDADGDPLLDGLNPGRWFYITHLEVVLRCPAGARVLARAQHDPHHALYFGQKTWGVQFHPEFDAPIMKSYIETRAERLIAEGLHPDQLLDELDKPVAGQCVLDRFSECVEQTG